MPENRSRPGDAGLTTRLGTDEAPGRGAGLGWAGQDVTILAGSPHYAGRIGEQPPVRTGVALYCVRPYRSPQRTSLLAVGVPMSAARGRVTQPSTNQPIKSQRCGNSGMK